jgi:hypothetical protein
MCGYHMVPALCSLCRPSLLLSLAGHLLRSGEYGGVKNVTTLPPCKSLSIKPLPVAEAAGSMPAAAAAAAAATNTAAALTPWWELDGEGQGPCSEVSIELLPSALQLCI